MRVSVLRYDFLHNSPSIIAGALYRNQDTIMTIDSFVSFSFDNSKETIIRSGVYHLKCNFRNTLNRLIILHAEHRFCVRFPTLWRGLSRSIEDGEAWSTWRQKSASPRHNGRTSRSQDVIHFRWCHGQVLPNSRNIDISLPKSHIDVTHKETNLSNP